MTIKELCSKIDHTILKPDANLTDIKKLCDEAKEYKFASVCINPYWVSKASELLNNTGVKVCTVIGFPLGANCTEVKAFEAEKAIKDGATELDMVINIGALKNNDTDTLTKDITAVVNVAKNKAIVKVIIETCLLTDDEIISACKCAMLAGATFVKTSTGFSTSGATIEDVKLMKNIVGNTCLVKASGGIRELDSFLAMIEAGADRIGTSNGVKIAKSLD